MAELSKTAKASMVKEVKQIKVETPIEAIRKLRIDLSVGLYVPSHRIQALLNAYDELAEASESYVQSMLWSRLIESGKVYRVSRAQDEFVVEELKSEDVYPASNDAPVSGMPGTGE